MKTLKTLTNSLLLIALLVVAPATSAPAQSASVLLQEGIYAEEIEGDLDAAIKIYEKIVTQAEQTQQAAAMAMYRIGMCRLKKGDKTQAAQQFQQIIERFPDQKSLVAKTRQQLGKIQPASAGVFRPVVDSSNGGQTYFYDFDKEKVFPCPEWLTRNSPPKEVLAWGRKNGIDFIISDKGEIELADAIAVKVAYGLWDSGGAVEMNAALDKGPHERTSLRASEDSHETSFPLTYVIKTREGGLGMLQILGKKDNNTRIRYKMLRDATAADLYTQLPPEVIRFIGNKYGSICTEAGEKKLYANSHVYYVAPDFMVYKGGMGYYRNISDRALFNKIRLCGTSYPNQTHYDIAGREMNTEIVSDKVSSGFYHIYWTPHEPVAPGQMFYYGWCINESQPLLQAPEAGRYSLTMQNQFGNHVIEAFFLVVPAGTEIVSKTDNYATKDTIGSCDVYCFSKEVLEDSNHRVDVVLAGPVLSAPAERRAESAQVLKEMGVAIAMYADDHQGEFPDALEQLKAYLDKVTDFQWVLDDFEYLGKGTRAGDSPPAEIAFHKSLLREGKGTNVLFSDGHVEFVTADELKKRGIAAGDVSVPSPAKVNLYEQMPNDVLAHIAGKYGSISAEAVAKGLYSNSHIYFMQADMTLHKGGMGYYRNSSDKPVGDRIHLSGTSDPDQTLYDVAGRKMNTEIVPDELRDRFYHIYWTPSEPIPPGQTFYYGWSSDDARKLSRAPGAETYALIMQNHFGSSVVETFFVVVPTGTKIVEKTEDYTAKETVGGFEVYYFSKEIPSGTNHRVDLALAPPAR